MSECGVLRKWKRPRKSTVLRDKPVPLSLCPPQNPCELATDQTWLSMVRSQWHDCLSHCTVCNQWHKIWTYLVQNRQLSLSSHAGTSSSTTSTVIFLKLWNHILEFTTTAVTRTFFMTTGCITWRGVQEVQTFASFSFFFPLALQPPSGVVYYSPLAGNMLITNHNISDSQKVACYIHIIYIIKQPHLSNYNKFIMKRSTYYITETVSKHLYNRIRMWKFKYSICTGKVSYIMGLMQHVYLSKLISPL